MPVRKTFLGTIARTLLTRVDRKRLPKTEGDLRLEGLNSTVEVIRDRWGIPHIYADSLEDVLFGQGFVHAQDRLFQMELNRRTAQGRLSELFGEMALETDRITRTFGFNRLGLVDWENVSDELRAGIQAYTRGINTFLKQKRLKLPLEFTMLGQRPEPWTPEDTMAFSRVMVWQLSHAWQGEIIRAEIAEKVGAENAAELEIHYPVGNPITLPKGIEFNALDPDGTLRKTPGPFLDRGKGSNAWVVSPNRSETGNAVLCNDMHLALSMPSLWYQIHLVAGEELHVTGVSLPGLPMVLVGHNPRISWGMTLAFTDAEDLFVEQIDSQNRYLFQDEWRDLEIIDETIEVKRSPVPHLEKVMLSHHGPIISDVVGSPENKLSVCSMALRPTHAMDGWFKLNKAGNWDDFVDAMRLIEAPQLNVSYADVENNIGHWVTGAVPIRANGDGRVPAPGWSGDYEWVGVVPFEEMPHALNPEQGYLVSCNHKLVPDDVPNSLGDAPNSLGDAPNSLGDAPNSLGDAPNSLGDAPNSLGDAPNSLGDAPNSLGDAPNSLGDVPNSLGNVPHFLGNVWMNGFRAQRLTELIESKQKLSMLDHQSFHMDVKCIPGLELVSRLEGITDPDPDVQLALRLLRTWDGYLTPESVVGTVYEVVRYTLVRSLLDPGLGPELATRLMGKGFHPLLNHSNEFYGHDTVVMLRLLADPDSWWVKQAGGHDILISSSLKKAMDWLRENLGVDEAEWHWGRIHKVNFEHAMSLQKPFDQVFDRGPFQIGGDTDTPLQTAMHAENPYDNKAWSPTFRQIVDLGDLSKSVTIVPPGQSGQTASPHYDDLVQPWLEGEYIPMLWTREQVDAEATATLILKGK